MCQLSVRELRQRGGEKLINISRRACQAAHTPPSWPDPVDPHDLTLYHSVAITFGQWDTAGGILQDGRMPLTAARHMTIMCVLPPFKPGFQPTQGMQCTCVGLATYGRKWRRRRKKSTETSRQRTKDSRPHPLGLRNRREGRKRRNRQNVKIAASSSSPACSF